MNDYTRSFDIGTEGRTLTGLAFKWDTPAKVRDPGKQPYMEEFSRGAADKTLQEHPLVPVLRNHRLNEDPVGVSTFHRSEEGLVFTAPLSRTRAADEVLELVNDGAMRSVSVRFASFKDRKRMSTDGWVTTRMEIGLRELSVVTTGFGQHPGAEVLAVRSEEGTPRLDAVRQRLILLQPVVY